MKNGATERAREKFHSYVTRRYCWIQNDSLCDKLDRISCTKKVMNYYKQFELDDEYQRFPLKIYENPYDLHCNFQSAIENKLQMMYIPNLARNKLYRSHIEKYYENRIYLDFWKLTRRIKSCFRGSSVLMKQVSLFELIKREKEFKKNRMLKSGILRKENPATNKRKKNWREFGEKTKTGIKAKRIKRKKNMFDFNLNLDFLDGKLEGVDQHNITGLLNNMSRLVSKSNIELEILGNGDEVMKMSFMKGTGIKDQGKYEEIGWGGNYEGDDKENVNLSEIQVKMTKVKGDALFEQKKKVQTGKKYVRSSIVKKNSLSRPFVFTKAQNFSQKFSKKKENNEEGTNKNYEPRSINSSFYSPERKKDKYTTLFDSKKNNFKIRGGSKSSRRMQQSNLFVMKTYRSNDRTSRSPNRSKKKMKYTRSKKDKKNLSIPFVISSKNTPRVPSRGLLSSKTDEKRSRNPKISKICGTMDINEDRNKVLFGSEFDSKGSDENKKQYSSPEKNILRTPQKKGNRNGDLNKIEKAVKINEERQHQNNKEGNLLFGNLKNPLEMNIENIKKNEAKQEKHLFDSGKSPNNASNSKLSQNFISEINEKDILKADKLSNFQKIKQKNSLFENSSIEKIRQDADWKLDSRANGKENETLSYNLSGTLQSKKMEMSGKRGQFKFRSNQTNLSKSQTKEIKPQNLIFKILKLFRKNSKHIFLEDILDFKEIDVHLLLRGFSRREKLGFLMKTFYLVHRIKGKLKKYHILLKIFKRLKAKDGMEINKSSIDKTPYFDKLVKRDFSSKKITNKNKYLNSYKKKSETITTKEILNGQSTNNLNSHKKDSYMFNTSYKTNQKQKRESKKNTLIMSHYHREKQVGSVLTYSDVNKTNISNQLRKESENGVKYNKDESINRTHLTKRRQKFPGKKESNLLKNKKNKRPPIRSVSSVMKLTRDMVFNTQQNHLKSIKNPKFKKSESKSIKHESKEPINESPKKKRESETDRVRQKQMQFNGLNGLEFDTQKSLISNFWNDKLTKRQSIQKSKLKGSSIKAVKERKQLDKKHTQMKWKRKTVKSLRDKGLELRSGNQGESLLSSKQETSLIKGSMRRVSMTGMVLLKNKSPNKLSGKNSALKIKKLRKKLIGVGKKETSRLKINKSIKMNFKGNFRKMKSISPPSNWSISRFNKMKNNFFKKKKGDGRLKQMGVRTEATRQTDNSKSQTLSGKKKILGDKESPQEIGSSSNFYCNNPYSNINEKPRISRVLARPRERLDKSLNDNNFNENSNNFFKKTLPEISEGETNESSEHTIVISSKKKSNSKEEENNEGMETKVTSFKNKVKPKKIEKRLKIKNDVIQRHSFGVNMKSSLNKPNIKQINRKSPLGKRLIMQNRPRQSSRSTNELKHYVKEPCTSEEIITSSRNQNLKKNFEELSKQMKTNADRFYLGNPRVLEKNEDTRFKIMNAKRSIKQKSKVDGSRLTDNGREILESQDTEMLQSDAIKTSTNNLLKYNNRKKAKKNMEQKENRSPDPREKFIMDGTTILTPDQNQGIYIRKNNNSLKKEGMGLLQRRHFEQNRSLDKAKFYLPRNLKAFKSTKMNLMHFEKHKLSQQKTIHARSELKKVPFHQKKKRMQVNGSQESLKTQDFIQKRFKPGKANRMKPGLMIIKKKLNSKNSLLKAKSFDKSRLLKDNGFGVFTFGK